MNVTKRLKRYSYKTMGEKNRIWQLCDYSRSYIKKQDAINWYNLKGKLLEKEFNRKLIFKTNIFPMPI